MSACCIGVAVLLPCLDEEAAIAGVVAAFRQALPDAQVYVYDNGSTDATAKRALEAGAVVRLEPLRGKGNVVRRMFADVEADVYVLADGDGTYDASAAPAMVDRLIAENLDMVVGVRVEAEGQDAYRQGHKMGNALLNRMIRGLFGGVFTDISSGYRVMSSRLVKSFPALSQRFEIEPELAAHCAHLRLPCAEMPTRYVERPEGRREQAAHPTRWQARPSHHRAAPKGVSPIPVLHVGGRRACADCSGSGGAHRPHLLGDRPRAEVAHGGAVRQPGTGGAGQLSQRRNSGQREQGSARDEAHGISATSFREGSLRARRGPH